MRRCALKIEFNFRVTRSTAALLYYLIRAEAKLRIFPPFKTLVVNYARDIYLYNVQRARRIFFRCVPLSLQNKCLCIYKAYIGRHIVINGAERSAFLPGKARELSVPRISRKLTARGCI